MRRICLPPKHKQHGTKSHLFRVALFYWLFISQNIQDAYKLSEYFAKLHSFPYNFPHCALRYLQLSTGSSHRFPGAASESFTHSVDRLFGNTWPPRATLSLMTDASSITKLFIPPSHRRLRRTTTSKLPSERALNRHKTSRKFEDTPTTLGR
jgi:hypothetical protein